MTSLLDSLRKLPEILIYLIVSLIVAYIAVAIIGSLFDWPSIRNWAPNMPNSVIFWSVTVTILLFAGLALKKPLGPLAWLILALIVVVHLSPFFGRLWEGADRRLNDGDWSTPADYVPRVNGGTFRVAAGDSKTVDIRGTVKVPIPVHHCLDISPRGKFHISWDSYISNAFITPKDGGVERTTIVALPASQC